MYNKLLYARDMGLKIGLHIKNSCLKRPRIDWRIVSRKNKDDSQLQIGKKADKKLI
jgi:hypothetical protein